MAPYIKITLLTCALFLWLNFAEVHGAMRSVRDAKKNKKPATTAHTTTKPGQQVATNPGQQVATNPGQQVATNPGQQVATNPGQQVATNPGQQVATNPGGELPTTPKPLIVLGTQVPIVDHAGFTYLGQTEGTRYYISDEKKTKADALKSCEELGQFKKLYTLASLQIGKDYRFVTDKLDSFGDTESYYVNIVIEDRDGKQVAIADSLHGRSEFVLDGQSNPTDINEFREKRETPLVSYGEQRIKRGHGKIHQIGRTMEGGGAASASTGAGKHFVTIMETKYPWLENWTNASANVCPSSCKPTVCTVATEPCSLKTNDCTVTRQSKCEVMNAGNCSMVCENCQIEKPICYVREPKCVVIKERVCKITPPNCKATQDDCTVERPECVSRQPPCVKTNNTAPECVVPEKCVTNQAMNCKEVVRPCDRNEYSPSGSCTYKECEPMEICMTPEYCRFDIVVCPPVETFCPPEIVKCPPPVTICEEPEILCEDPKIYCPPPTVVCTKPLVNCSAPTLSCPNVVTSCPNPEFSCPPPDVTCKPPAVECTPPKNPCPVSPIPHQDCLTECKGNCNCIKIIKKGREWTKEKCKCDEQLKFICEGTEPKSTIDGSTKPARPKRG